MFRFKLPRQMKPFSHVNLAVGVSVLVLWFATVSNARIGEMNWEGNLGCASSWSADGLIFANARGTICKSDGSGINSVSSGSKFSNDVGGLKIMHGSGLPFTPLSMDVGEYSMSVLTTSILVVGYHADGSTVSVQFLLDRVADGPGGAADFQNFAFPGTFAGIIRLEVPTTRWSLDNFVFSTTVPPSLPRGQQLGSHYRAVTNRFSRPILDNVLMVGSDYAFRSGFSSPTSTSVAIGEITTEINSTYSPFYAFWENRLYYVDSIRNTAFGYGAGTTMVLATPSDTYASGPAMNKIDFPRPTAGGLVFLAYSTSNSDQFGIYWKSANTTSALVTPSTALPASLNLQPLSTPKSVPSEIATSSNGYFAFDTSLIASPTKRRLYVGSTWGFPIQYITGEGDTIASGGETYLVDAIDAFVFNAQGLLEVNATLDVGSVRLYFAPWGLDSMSRLVTVSPVNAGKSVSGERLPAWFNRPAILLTKDGEIYQESAGRYFRVIGPGDKIGSETISLLELKSLPGFFPSRAVVEARYESNPNQSHVLEIELDDPITHPPRFGAPYIHPESKDWFVPLSHTTADKSQWLARSFDLKSWHRLRPLAIKSPIQHVVISSEEALGAVFKMRLRV